MKTLMRPRFWLSMLAGVVAGVIVWTLPPLADATVRLPGPDSWSLHAISSNARYLVTWGRHDDAKDGPNLYHVWDRARGFHAPSIQVDGHHVLFSPDETQLAVLKTPDIGVHVTNEVRLYDLAAARMSRKWKIKADHVLFSREGTLLYVFEGVLRDPETNAEVRRLPASIDDFAYERSFGAIASYRKKNFARLYSWHTGELLATHDLVGNFMSINTLTRDGRAVDARGWKPRTTPWSANLFRILADTSDHVQRRTDHNAPDFDRLLAPDGQHLVQFQWKERPAWLPDWWPGKKSISTVRIVHWPTDRELAAFSNVGSAQFSPDGSWLALGRADHAIDLYAFPFRKPWGLILAAIMLTACASWCVGDLWTRWRTRARLTQAPDTPPH